MTRQDRGSSSPKPPGDRLDDPDLLLAQLEQLRQRLHDVIRTLKRAHHLDAVLPRTGNDALRLDVHLLLAGLIAPLDQLETAALGQHTVDTAFAIALVDRQAGDEVVLSQIGPAPSRDAMGSRTGARASS